MFEKEIIIESDTGVHARPAMMLVREAMKFKSQVTLIKDNLEADGKSIMSVLGLAITGGSKLILRAEGPDQEKVVNSLLAIIENGFKE